MADFGVKATQLQSPQGAGSSPISPVQEPAGNQYDVGNLGGLFTGLVKDKNDKPWNSVHNDYVKKITAVQESVLTGQIDERRAYNQMKMITIQTQRSGADYGPEFTKAISNSFTELRTGTGIEELQDINKIDRDRSVDAAKGLAKAGVYVPPLSEQSQIDRDFLVSQEAHITNLERIAKKSQDDIQFRNQVDAANRSSQEFNWKQQDRARQEDAWNALAGMKRDSLGYIPQMISNINTRSISIEEKRMEFQKSMAGLSNVASNLLIGDPASLKNYQDTIQGLQKLGEQMFDPSQQTKDMQDELQRRILAEQLKLTQNTPILRVAALDKLMPNSPAVTMVAGQSAQRALMDDLNKATGANVVPSVVANDSATQKATFQTVRDTIAKVKSGRSTDPTGDLDAAATVASSTLKTVGMVNASSNVSLEYAKDFIASPEYAEIIKAGKYDSAAADQARPVFQDLYVSAFGERFFGQIGQTIGDVNYVDGKPDPNNATLGRVIDFEMSNDGGLKAVKKIDPSLKITASNLYIDRQVREAQKLADGLTKVVRAAAHLDGRTDYAKYWEENKHFLARGIYPPPEFIEQLKSQGYNGTGSALNPANYTKSNGRTDTANK